MNINFIVLTLVLVQFVISYSVYNVGNTYYEQRIQNGKTKPKVFDISYKYLPDYSDSELLENIIDLMVLLPIFAIFWFTNNGELYKEYLVSVLLIQLLRSIFIHSTILPKTKTCIKNAEEYNWYNIIFGHCYDKIFSGHLATSIMTFIFLYKMNVVRNIPFAIFYNLLLSLGLLLNRAHYTVDLLVALLASYTIYNVDIDYFHFLK